MTNQKLKEDFCGKEDFLCINKRVNMFDIVGCHEEQASKIIAWLLNPREAHNFGKEFFEAMLDSISKTSSIKGYKYQTKTKKTTSKSLEKRDLLKKYEKVIIQIEYCIDNNCKKKEDGRVDILLCLEDVQALFIIENKYGSKEHGRQMENYFTHFSQPAYKDYTVFYIYLDIFLPEDRNFCSDSVHWHFLSYDWIIEFLKDNLKKSNQHVKKIIRDILVEFDCREENEPYFKPYYSQADDLYKKYKTKLEKYEDPFPYKPGRDSKNPDKKHFAMYNDFYENLKTKTLWDKVKEKLGKRKCCWDENYSKNLCFTLLDIDQKSVDDKTKKWSFCVYVFLENVQKNESNCESPERKKKNLKVVLYKLETIKDLKYRSVWSKSIKDFDFDNKEKEKELWKLIDESIEELKKESRASLR